MHEPEELRRVKEAANAPLANGVNGHAEAVPSVELPLFPEPIPASQLKAETRTGMWLWHGYLLRGGATMLTALWKSGKTTLLSHLLKALEEGGQFCGLATTPAKVLYVTEESQGIWVPRRDRLGIADNVHFLVRPLMQRADWPTWFSLVNHLVALVERERYDLVAIDPISDFWPVLHENDAPEVQTALMPLRKFGERVSILACHHPRKSGGAEFTQARGSGAMSAWFDVLMELRRFDPSRTEDRRRIITAEGRWEEEITRELVIERSADGVSYEAQGSRGDVSCREIRAIIGTLLPSSPPGLSIEEILGEWPGDEEPRRQRFLAALAQGYESGAWERTGKGVKGDPFTYWLAVTSPFGPDA